MMQCETGIFRPEEPTPQGEFQGIIKAGTAIGGYFYAVVKPDHSLWTWGNNDYGNPGNGTTVSSEVPTQVPNINVVAMDVSLCSIIAVDSAGDIWYWGHPTVFQTENVLSPTKISHIDDVISISMKGLVYALDKNGCIWYFQINYPYNEPLSEWIEPQQLVTIPRAVEITDGNALTESGSVIGYAYQHQPERGGLADTLYDVACVSTLWGFHSAIAKNDGTVWQWGHVQDADGTWQSRKDPVQVSGLADIISVDVFFNTNVALKSDGSVWYWGKYNPVPEKVPGLQDVSLVEVGAGETYFFKREDGTYWTWNREHNELKPVMRE
ncbi:hypothetical protein KAH55_00080 [bacterium]|nr:hypothetical protein [bacterium]